MKQTFGFQ